MVSTSESACFVSSTQRMAQLAWDDGSTRHVHVDAADVYNYQVSWGR